MRTPDINTILNRPESNRSSARGAPMGHADRNESSAPLLLRRIHFVDGDYGADGTYWGSGGGPLWCAYNPDDGTYAAAMGTRIYMRARSRKLAMLSILEDYPDVKFKVGHPTQEEIDKFLEGS